MTPQSISQRARELWEIAKAQDGWDESMRMAYIMGACDGMADMQNNCHPLKPKNDVTISASTKPDCKTPMQTLDAFILKGAR